MHVTHLTPIGYDEILKNTFTIEPVALAGDFNAEEWRRFRVFEAHCEQ